MTAQILRLADFRAETRTETGHSALLDACRNLVASFAALEQRTIALETTMGGLQRDGRSILTAHDAVKDAAVALREAGAFSPRRSA